MALSVTGLRDRIVGKLDAAFPVPEGPLTSTRTCDATPPGQSRKP